MEKAMINKLEKLINANVILRYLLSDHPDEQE